MNGWTTLLLIAALAAPAPALAQKKYTGNDGKLRVTLAKQPFSPTGPSLEPIRIGMLWLDAHPDFNTPDPREVMAHGNKVRGVQAREAR